MTPKSKDAVLKPHRNEFTDSIAEDCRTSKSTEQHSSDAVPPYRTK